MSKNQLILALAPMAGYTDMGFRRICTEYGVDFTTTEMVSVKALSYNQQKTKDIMALHPDEAPASLQLFGDEPALFGEMVEKITRGACPYKSIDINMGCPAPKIVKGGGGAALLNHLDQASFLMEEAVKHSHIPVSVKCRKGFLDGEETGLSLAKRAEEVGISFLTVHGRSREQYYAGEADWDFIGRVADAVSIPVIGNGDIKERHQIDTYLKQTKVAGCAIGRGAVGRPWIFKELKDPTFTAPNLDEILTVAERHFVYTLEDKSEKLAILEMRKHFIHYFRGFPNAKALREEIMKMTQKEEIVSFLHQIPKNLEK